MFKYMCNSFSYVLICFFFFKISSLTTFSSKCFADLFHLAAFGVETFANVQYVLQKMIDVTPEIIQCIYRWSISQVSFNKPNKELSRLLLKATLVDEYIENISSYKLRFFQKHMLFSGLNVAIPRPVSAKDIRASFECAYRILEHNPAEDKKLTEATLKFIARNCVEQRNSSPLNTLLQSIYHLKKQDDIVITKSEKRNISRNTPIC